MNEPLKFHPLADIFPLMEGAEFEDLVADIKANGLREKIDLYGGKIVDGRNRYRALQRLGIDQIAAKDFGNYFRKAIYAHRVGGQVAPHEQDNDARARAYIISKNIHRRHLTAEQKRDLLVKLVAAQPEKADRVLAREAKVDHKQVSRARRKAEATGAIAPVDKRVGGDGIARNQPVKRKRGKRLALPVLTPEEKEQRNAEVAALLDDDPLDRNGEVIQAILDHIKQMRWDVRERLFAGLVEEFDPPSWWDTDGEEDVLELVEEVLGDQPLTTEQTATFKKIKNRLQQRARVGAKQEASNDKAIASMVVGYKAALPPIIAKLMAAGLARDMWLALTIRGPCGYRESDSSHPLLRPLIDALVDALEEALGPLACAPACAAAENATAPDISARL